MRVLCERQCAPTSSEFHENLTIGREYEVIGIEADDFRIVDDTGDPVLFNSACFRVIDSAEPDFWRCSRGEDGERYAYPAEWDEPGFFEDYHGGVQAIRQRFWADHRRYYGLSGRSDIND